MPPVDRRLRPLVPMLAALLASAFASAGARADNDPAVGRGLQYLRGKVAASGVGETALIALGMIKADVPANDPSLSACVAKLRTRFDGEGVYNPERKGGPDVYEAAVVALAFANLPAEMRGGELPALVRYLVGKQKSNGSWDYDNREKGDTSITQYAVLGLWESENGGATVPPDVWERAASWYISTQAGTGSWNYHRDEGQPETLSMTAAGVGSLLICQRQLARYRRESEATSPLMTPVTPDGRRARFNVSVSTARVEQAVRRGINWLSANFVVGRDPIVGQSPYYALYGIERLGALANRETLGRVNWFDQGRQYIRSTQGGDGSWTSQHGEVPNTVWAILFVTKSTAKTIARITVKPLGAGTLLGGRGLPKDLSSLTVAGGRVVSRPMNGAVEGMIAALEDPRAEHADSALSGLVKRYQAEGAAALKPHKDRFRKLLNDRDPGLRKVAAWALARTGDLDTAPALIGALTDADESVVAVAREGLQLLSRKLDGLGPPSPSSPDQRREAAGRWSAWYATIRPLDVEGQDVAEAGAPSTAARSPR